MSINQNVGFIGAGNMGMAVIGGLTKAKKPDINVFAYDLDISKKSVLESMNVNFLTSEEEITKNCKYVFLLTKPQQAGETLKKISAFLTAETVLVSFCAGISESFIKKYTDNNNLKIILVMPNTPMTLGLGACAAAKCAGVENVEFIFVRGILESCGICEEIPADKMNEIICINASSPAFIYYFAKCFADYAEEVGIDAGTAFRLFSEALTGSAKMMIETGKTAEELITQVTSKGGTTAAGLEEFQKAGFAEAVKNACRACTLRAYQLGEN